MAWHGIGWYGMARHRATRHQGVAKHYVQLRSSSCQARLVPHYLHDKLDPCGCAFANTCFYAALPVWAAGATVNIAVLYFQLTLLHYCVLCR